MTSYARKISCLVGSFAVLSIVGVAVMRPAQAITVTNRDDKEHKITIIEGELKKDHPLKAAGVLENLCLNGCVVRLNDSESDEYELDGTEVVSIEDGYLYYDGPDAPPEPPAAAPKQ